MSASSMILEKIVEWGKNDAKIRGMILEGSVAQKDSDNLSDLDVNIFLEDPSYLSEDDQWISSIGNVWVYSPDKMDYKGKTCPTRLVIYEGGIKVDFSIWTPDLIESLEDDRHYDSGYKVLLDKDNLFKDLPPPSLKYVVPKKPTQEEFSHAITEYWFEEYHVAKYLKREDLWLVKFRDWSLKFYLLKMMEWYALAKHNWDYNVKWDGKQIKKWLDPEIYESIFGIYSHFDPDDGWKALKATNSLFSSLSKKTAKLLNYKYPIDVEQNLLKFTSELEVT